MDSTNIISQRCSKKAQETVIKLIETTVEKSELQYLCCFITPGQFEDVCLERCIAGICGYPLCKRPYNDEYGSRQYIIRNRAVYDITRRRNFCSNVCFEASLRLLIQIPSSPLYLRGQGESDRPSIVLPDVSQLKGSHGDKVTINSTKPLSDSDIKDTQKTRADNNPSDSQPLPSNTTVNGKHRRKNPKFKKIASDECELPEETNVGSGVDRKSVGKNNSTVVEGGSLESRSERRAGAPVPQQRSTAADLACRSGATPNGDVTPRHASSATSGACSGSVTAAAAVSEVEDHLRQWLQWNSFLLLLGLKKLQERCGLTLPRAAEDEDSTFTNRVARIRSLHAATLAKVDAFYKGADCYADTTEDDQKDPGLPLIDQHNINSWRRNIFLQKLEPCERCVVARLRLPRKEVREKLKAVTLTLRFTPHNLHLRPAQWALVALVLFKLISLSCDEVHEAFTDDAALQAEVQPRLAVLGMQLQDLDALVLRLLEPPLLRKAYVEYQKVHSLSKCPTQREDAPLRASGVADSYPGGEHEANDQSEYSLSNIGVLSIAQTENDPSPASVSGQCNYSQTDELD